jgi:hypothetical protein
MRLFTTIVLLSASLAAPAMADGALDKLITPQDQQRLDDYENTRTAALAEARNGGAGEDLAELDAALSGCHSGTVST